MQFYVVRFLLGAAEAGFFPGVVYYLTLWFPAHYRGRAISRFYVAFPISSIVMGAIAGALLNLQGHFGLAGWQWLFLIEGSPAVVLSVFIYVYLPDGPADVVWLTEAERMWIADQLSGERTGHTPGNVIDALRSLKDRRVRELGIANICIMSATYAAALSAPAVIQAVTKWNVTAIGFAVAIAYIFGMAGMIGNGWHSDRRRERYLHTVIPLIGMAAAFAVMGTSNATWIVVTAYALSVLCANASQAAFWLIPSDAFVGSLAEVGVAAIGSIGMIGAFIGPYAFGLIRDSTGSYSAGLLLVAALYLLAAALVGYSLRSHTRAQVAVAATTV
jgi:MFS transporter, ACS family, tartrate transporter